MLIQHDMQESTPKNQDDSKNDKYMYRNENDIVFIQKANLLSMKTTFFSKTKLYKHLFSFTFLKVLVDVEAIIATATTASSSIDSMVTTASSASVAQVTIECSIIATRMRWQWFIVIGRGTKDLMVS